MMTHSESLAALAPALVAATAELEHASKDRDNPFYKSRYATLESVIDTVRPVLWKHGITVIQGPGFESGGLASHEELTGGKNDGKIEAVGIATVTTMLLHESGEWIMSRAGTPISRPDPQGTGGAISYLRRYALAAMCGIGQEDDDGNAASTPVHRSAPAGTRASSNGSSKSEAGDMIPCPACEGPMWDNREGKTNPKSPDLKCKERTCDHAIWLSSWRDQLLKRVESAAVAGAMTAEDAAKVTRALETLRPDYLARTAQHLDELETAVANEGLPY